LVVSADIINQQPLVVTVVVGTDAANVTREYPTNVRVPAAESGLPKDTVFLCFHLRSIDAARLASESPAGRLSNARMTDIARAIKLTLDLT
jgi:mRNA interferase MazF